MVQDVEKRMGTRREELMVAKLDRLRAGFYGVRYQYRPPEGEDQSEVVTCGFLQRDYSLNLQNNHPLLSAFLRSSLR